MSGHSKWSTIKHQKAVKDKKRGQLFSKLAKAISVAVATGGGANPDSNYKLKLAIDQAKQANMPKENIDRALVKANTDNKNFEEVVYEGFAPGGVGIILEAATNNRNKTAQQLKYLLDRGGGTLAVPGAVSFNFETKGYLLIKKENTSSLELKLIDLGAEDIVDTKEGLEVFVSKENFVTFKKRLKEANFIIKKSSIIRTPKSTVDVDHKSKKMLLNLLASLESLSDIQEIYSNAKLK